MLDETRLPSTAHISNARAREAGEETLLERFHRHYKTLIADTEDLVRTAKEIRYQVYCIENSFENRANHTDGLETDSFDSHAVHSLLIHRGSGEAIGTVRLVLPVGDAPQRSFAIQQVSDHAGVKDSRFFPLRRTAEVSRFSISKHIAHRRTDSIGGDLCAASEDRRSAPVMRLGLIQTLIRMSAQHGITHWCAVMEPKLLRMLAAMAIHFEPIGSLVEYHGLRQPCYCNIARVLQRVKLERPAFWDVLTDRGAFWNPLLEAN